jgi:hypothetical protein
VDRDFEAINDKAQDLLWPENQDETRWADAMDRYAEQAGMPWLPPRGLDQLKLIACNRGLWEDLGNGSVTKRPKKKTTSAQIVQEPQFGDEGKVRLTINPQNAGPAPRIYYAEDAGVSDKSPQLMDNPYVTAALRVHVLVCDPSGLYETGDPVTWVNELKIRNRLDETGPKRKVELFAAPRGAIRYTTDGSEPRNGLPYADPVELDDRDVLLRVFAEADGLEAKSDFRFPAKGRAEVQVDPVKAATLVSRTNRNLDSRARVFEGLSRAGEVTAVFEGVVLTVGQGAKIIQVNVGEVEVEPAFIEALLVKIMEKFDSTDPITMTYKRARFLSGHDLQAFAEKLGIQLRIGDVEQ